MRGTIRYFHPEAEKVLVRRAEEVLAGVARHGMPATLSGWARPIPAGQRRGFHCLFLPAWPQNWWAPKNVKVLEYPTMGGEDMAFFLREVPGTFYFLGAGNPEKGIVHPHHHPRFDFDEDVLWLGVALLTATVWEYTQKN